MPLQKAVRHSEAISAILFSFKGSVQSHAQNTKCLNLPDIPLAAVFHLVPQRLFASLFYSDAIPVKTLQHGSAQGTALLVSFWVCSVALQLGPGALRKLNKCSPQLSPYSNYPSTEILS